MPNWVRNRVIAKDYAELKKHLVDENGYVDFSLAIPKSKDLDITCGSYSYEIKSKYFHNEAAQKKLDKQQSEVGSYLDKIYNSISKNGFEGLSAGKHHSRKQRWLRRLCQRAGKRYSGCAGGPRQQGFLPLAG